ncbi:hypothetical protein PQ455_10325 [Sphingomonas naphthae]|uniref:Putative tail fiber protein gp53-like C-terminal domain-containing protein n=1 Tax=Sphingomonas naphthae TaxID=1813468 RepID=A0ABY7TG58_9SPHN|nr:hypothetical protein [Sphingomonas naphthae]WCT72043.1 hypothetical protein PQ455_10325 [Sphingomonas naphthae]
MHRIDTPGSLNGHFSVGDPQAGQRATVLGQDWPEAVQEAICYVIEAMGIGLAKGANSQLYDAIRTLANQRAEAAVNAYTVPDLSGSYIAVGRRGAAGGVASLDGDGKVPSGQVPNLAASYIASGQKGAANGVASLDGSGKVPSGQMPGVLSVGATGYAILPGGLIIQWGGCTTSGGGSAAVSFPITFPNAFFRGFAVNAAGGAPTAWAGTDFGSPSGMTVWQAQSSGVASPAAAHWIAFGF